MSIAAESRFSDRVDVRLVEVDAVVTDQRGRPVSGLGRDDFELLIDGRPLAIESFEAVGESSSSASPEEVRPLHLAIYVDGSNLDPGRRRDVLSALKSFLSERLGPRDRVLLAASDRFSQRSLQPFTDRPEPIAAALDLIAAMPVQERRAREFREILRGIDRLATSGSDATEATVRGQAHILMARIRADAAEAVGDAARATDNLRRLVDAVAGLDGLKAVLYVGGGLVLNPGGILGDALNQVAISSASSLGTDNPRADVQAWGFDDLSDRFHDLARHASGHRVAFYVLDAGDRGGSRGFGPVSGGAEVGAGASRGRDDAWAPGVSVSQRLDFDAPLRLLAEETGGRAALDGRDDGAALERLRGDVRSFYALAAELPDGAAGSGRIEVRVRGKRLRVSHRKTWRLLDADDQARVRVRSALFADFPDPALEFGLAAGDPCPIEGGRWAVTVTVDVPVDKLAVVADRSRHRGQLSIFIASSDGGLATAPVHKAVLPVHLSNQEILGAMGRDLVYRFEVQLEGGGTVAVGVRDDFDPRLSIRTLDLDLGPQPEAAP
ncbi:MAG: VWA domain-containing protein [Thermoanaerobaculia bacterium]